MSVASASTLHFLCLSTIFSCTVSLSVHLLYIYPSYSGLESSTHCNIRKLVQIDLFTNAIPHAQDLVLKTLQETNETGCTKKTHNQVQI